MKLALAVICALALLCACDAPAPAPNNPLESSASASLPAPAPLSRERCTRPDCSAEIVVRGQEHIRTLAIAGDRLIWGSYEIAAEPKNALRVLAKNGSQPEELASGLFGVCALEVAGDSVYFIEPGFRGEDHLRRVSLSGDKSQLLRTFRGACELALTSREAVHGAAGRLEAVPRAGGRARVLEATGPVNAIRAFGDTLYWASEDGVYRLQRKAPERVLSAGKVYGLAITREYLVVRKGGEEPGVVRARHDGKGARLLYGGDPHALVADERHAYVATSERGEQAIRKIALADGEMSLLVRRRGGWPALALDDTHLYFTDPDAGLVLRVQR